MLLQFFISAFFVLLLLLQSYSYANPLANHSANQFETSAANKQSIEARDHILSLHFVDIDIRELLNTLANLGATNFILSQSVQGNISIQLNQVPWQTALSSILASRGLRFIRNGNIYWIGPYSEIQAFQKARREEIALPFGGEDYSSPKQILIEARIVEADHRFARNLGMKLGLQQKPVNSQSTSLEGSEKQGFQSTLDLAATGLSGFDPGSAAVTLLSKQASRLIQYELSALEADGQGKILSNPRIMTADQVKAIIEQGTELPYQSSSANGGNKIQFRKANLRLEVVPKIHIDGKISLLVGINKDSVGMKTEQGYAIDTKNLSSEVTVENGGTVVLGGIYQTTERNDEVKVPLLGDIPFLGWLFRNQSRLKDKTELLVFLTPTIISKP